MELTLLTGFHQDLDQGILLLLGNLKVAHMRLIFHTPNPEIQRKPRWQQATRELIYFEALKIRHLVQVRMECFQFSIN